MAPHATFVDGLAIIFSRSVPVAKAELSQVPVLGKIGIFLQFLFVKRESKDSRKRAFDGIRRHAFSVKVRVFYPFTVSFCLCL